MESKKLFRGGHDWWNNAIITRKRSFDNKWFPYTEGYLLSARILSDKLLADQQDIDLLVYPIIFLYRHYFELKLKEIIQHGNELLEEPYKVPPHHDLMTLWSNTKPIIQQLWPNEQHKEFNDIDSVFIEFNNFDLHSDSFRYPITKKGEFTLGGITYINIRNFVEKIQPTINMLEGVAMAIAAFEDYKSEIPREF